MVVVVGLDFAAAGDADDSFHAYRFDVSEGTPVVPSPLFYRDARAAFLPVEFRFGSQVLVLLSDCLVDGIEYAIEGVCCFGSRMAGQAGSQVFYLRQDRFLHFHAVVVGVYKVGYGVGIAIIGPFCGLEKVVA